MKLNCKNKGNNKSITTGKEYEVINETENRYAILNDKGVQANYAKNLFQIVVEAAPQIPIIGELTAETFIFNGDDEAGFKIIVKINGQDDYVIKENDVVDVSESDISCGVKNVTNLNGLMYFMNAFKEEFSDYLEEKTQLFKIDEDFDFDSFYKEIAELLITDLMEDNSGKCLYLFLSTNTSDNDNYNEDIIESLNGNSEVELTGTNPNTGNDIRVWVLKV